MLHAFAALGEAIYQFEEEAWQYFRFAAADTNNPMSPQYFPATLSDDTLKTELLFGSEIPNLKFKKEQWATIKFKEN